MRYRLMATYRGASYEAGVGPTDKEVTLFAACPPPEDLGFEPAAGHWRKAVSRAEVDAVWESRPSGMFCGEPCLVLDDLGEHLHISYLGHDLARAGQLGYSEVEPGVFELLATREDVTDITEDRLDHAFLPWQEAWPGGATGGAANSHRPVTAPEPAPTYPEPGPGPAATDPEPGADPALTDPGPALDPAITDPEPGVSPAITDPALADLGPAPEPAHSNPGPAPDPGITHPGPAPEPGITYPGPPPDPGITYPGPPPDPGITYPGPPPGPGMIYPRPAPDSALTDQVPGSEPAITDPGPEAEPALIDPGPAPDPGITHPGPAPEPAITDPGPDRALIDPESAPDASISYPEPGLDRAVADPGPDGGAGLGRRHGRAARRPPRAQTRQIFSELAGLAALPRDSYAVDEAVDGAICLVSTDTGFEVFSAAGGVKQEARLFNDEEAAYFYLFGLLAAEAVRDGRLVPPGTSSAR
jgi:hypothetical protein